MTWQPLSQRMSGVKPDGPYEGVPDHLRGRLLSWLELHGRQVAHETALLLRIAVPARTNDFGAVAHLLQAATVGDDEFLNVIDAVLHVRAETVEAFKDRDPVLTLVALLRTGASVWTVTDQHDALTRVVGEQAQATFSAAVAVKDAAADELELAWSNAYGRNGDPSDAWDHAIKAVEDILIPVVVPNKTKATLGDVVGTLNSAGASSIWKMTLPGHDQSHDVAPLVSMLRLIWPNHDRHGGGMKRVATVEEAQAAVGVAALIVQWHRQGWVVAKR